MLFYAGLCKLRNILKTGTNEYVIAAARPSMKLKCHLRDDPLAELKVNRF